MAGEARGGPGQRGGERDDRARGGPSYDDPMSQTRIETDSMGQVEVAADGALVVMDRGSTNGSFLVRQGVPRGLPAGKAATLVDGDHVRFGDREVTVVRDA